jgi:hypothetical protein
MVSKQERINMKQRNSRLKKGLPVWMLVGFLAGSVQAAYNVSIQAGSGSTNNLATPGTFSINAAGQINLEIRP